MTFEETIATVRSWLGQEIALNVTNEAYGAADGYLADFSGTLTRVDEPIPEIDAPVFYFRIDGDSGFGVHRAMFRGAEWKTIAGERSLEIALDRVVLSVGPVRQRQDEGR